MPVPEAFAVTSTTLSIAVSAFTACQRAYSLIQSLRNVPKQIQRLTDDVHGLYQVLGLLQAALAQDNVATARLPAQMVQDLELLLGTCTKLSCDIITILNPFIGADGVVKNNRWRNLKWELFKKSDVEVLRESLETCKLTINITVSSLNFVTGNQTQGLLEQIQQDVAHLRVHAGVQEQDIEAGVSDASIRALPSEDGLSIASYHLPLRRFLEDTASLLDPDASPSRRDSPACSIVEELPLELIRPERLELSSHMPLLHIRRDPTAVDALLSMVFSAAASGDLRLLPDCPFDDTAKILKLLHKLPSMSHLQMADDLITAIRNSGPEAEILLLWVCSAYRGRLSSAKSASLKIPFLPDGTHQFVLKSSDPICEAAFAKHLTTSPLTDVLFHGTSLDRLFAITCQGLRVLSHTPLMRHGAAAGAGIYCAEEPMMSWGYSSTGQTNTNWGKSEFSNFRVLLGVEEAGRTNSHGGLHVIKDASKLCVRYIFFIPAIVTGLPVARAIAPAMLSVFTSLRSGTLELEPSIGEERVSISSRVNSDI